MKSYDSLTDLYLEDESLMNEVSDLISDHADSITILVWDTIEEFAEFEVTEGWYNLSDALGDFNGAPNLLDYIDYESLGHTLVNSWDDTLYTLTSRGQVVYVLG